MGGQGPDGLIAMAKKEPPPFAKEADLCAAFVAALGREPRPHQISRDRWTAYPETADFDLLLVRESDGAQIGVEAKLRLTPHVVAQALPRYRWAPVVEGPDFRAVLVPWNAVDTGMGDICAALGITVLRVDPDGFRAGRTDQPDFEPDLPHTDSHFRDDGWFEWAPEKRCAVPDYVPDVAAGTPAPTKLTPWKISAIKLAVLLEERPVRRADFVHLQLSPSRWLQNPGAWLIKADGGWIAGPHMPNFRAQHPVNYEQIKADKEKWAPKEPAFAASGLKQAALI